MSIRKYLRITYLMSKYAILPVCTCRYYIGIYDYTYIYLLLSALKSWLQLILAKYDINGNYSQYIKATSTKLATIIVRPSVNKLQYFVAMETVT